MSRDDLRPSGSLSVFPRDVPPDTEIQRGIEALEALESERDETYQNAAVHSQVRAALNRAGGKENGELRAALQAARQLSKETLDKRPRLSVPSLEQVSDDQVAPGYFLGSLGTRIRWPYPIHSISEVHNGPEESSVNASVNEFGIMDLDVGPTNFDNVDTVVSAHVGVIVTPPLMIDPVCRMEVTPRFFNKWTTVLLNAAGPTALSEGTVRLSVLEFSSLAYNRIVSTTPFDKLWRIPLDAFQGPISGGKEQFSANPYTRRLSADVSPGESYLVLLTARVRLKGWGPTRDDDSKASDVAAQLVGWNVLFDVEFDRCSRPLVDFDALLRG